MALQIIEPDRPRCTFVLDGYAIPYLTGHLSDDGETWTVSVDERLAVGIPSAHLHDVLHLVADAMAVAAGYSSHGEHCTPLNPHMRKVGVINAVQHGSDGKLARELFGVSE